MEKNGTPGFAGDGACKQRFAGARRSHQQDALWYARAEPAIAFGSFRNDDDLLKFGLCLVDAGDVGKSHLGIGLDIDFGASTCRST